MREVVIVDAVRTPIGNFGGALSKVRPDDMGALVLEALIKRTGIDPAIIEEVYMGCANQAGEDNRNVARMATLLAGFPVEVPAVTVNRLCASGLQAVNLGFRAIKAGEGDVYIGAGVESMSRAPYSVPKAEKGFGWGSQTMWDTTLGWRYPNKALLEMYKNESMGETAENIYGVTPSSREEQDQFSYQSHQRAVEATNSGRFADEIIPVSIPQQKGAPIVVTKDERPRPDTTLEKLATLRPAFRKDGTVTAGNSSGVNDGASAVLIMSADKAKSLGLKPMARILSSASAGVNPSTMGLGPIPATRKALDRARLSIEDIGLIELNEAFAIQALAVIKTLNLDESITNVNGGAIALGHPLGCTGARLITTLVHEMKKRAPSIEGKFYGLATLCVGVGQGEATIIEWIND